MSVVGARSPSRETRSIMPGHLEAPGTHTSRGLTSARPRAASMVHAGRMETTDGVMVREAAPTDAFAVAALHLQAEREWGQEVPPRFLDTFADAWLRDRARRTFVAEDPRGAPLGTVHGSVVRKLPSPRRP